MASACSIAAAASGSRPMRSRRHSRRERLSRRSSVACGSMWPFRHGPHRRSSLAACRATLAAGCRPPPALLSARRRGRRPTAARDPVCAAARGFRLGRVARAADAVGADPVVRRDALARPCAIARGGTTRGANHRPGDAAPQPDGRQCSAVLAGQSRRSSSADARADSTRRPRRGSRRSVPAAGSVQGRHDHHRGTQSPNPQIRKSDDASTRRSERHSPDAAEPARQRREVRTARTDSEGQRHRRGDAGPHSRSRIRGLAFRRTTGRAFGNRSGAHRGLAEGGTGLGLAIVHDLVARHGGTVYVDGGKSGGARFVLDLDAPAA